jgi:hypothetical protein
MNQKKKQQRKMNTPRHFIGYIIQSEGSLTLLQQKNALKLLDQMFEKKIQRSHLSPTWLYIKKKKILKITLPP